MTHTPSSLTSRTHRILADLGATATTLAEHDRQPDALRPGHARGWVEGRMAELGGITRTATGERRLHLDRQIARLEHALLFFDWIGGGKA